MLVTVYAFLISYIHWQKLNLFYAKGCSLGKQGKGDCQGMRTDIISS